MQRDTRPIPIVLKRTHFPPSGDRRSSSKSGQRTPSVFSPLRGRFDPAIRKEDTTAVDLVKVEVTVEVEVIADGVRYGAGDFRPGPSGISVGD